MTTPLYTTAEQRVKRMTADDMIGVSEAAKLAGVSRVTMTRWLDIGRAIGLPLMRRGRAVPRWQFEPPIWDALPKIATILRTDDVWEVMRFLETPCANLIGNMTPRQALMAGMSVRTIHIATCEPKKG